MTKRLCDHCGKELSMNWRDYRWFSVVPKSVETSLYSRIDINSSDCYELCPKCWSELENWLKGGNADGKA